MHAIEQILESALWLLLTWSIRWGVGIGLLAIWFTLRPPRRSELRYALAFGVLLVGLALPFAPSWGPGFWSVPSGSEPPPNSMLAQENAGASPVADNAPPAFEDKAATDDFVPYEPLSVDPTADTETRSLHAARPIDETNIASSTVLPRGDPTSNDAAMDRENTVAAAPSPLRMDGRRAFVAGLSVLYLAGAVWGLLRIAGGALLLARLKRTSFAVNASLDEVFSECCSRLGLSASVRIAAHDGVSSPIVCGFIRPMILVPGDWSGAPATSQQACLLHELSHVKRGDHLVVLLIEVVKAVFFFHPLVRWLTNRIDLEREYICDEWASALHGDSRAYARVLLDEAGRSGRLNRAAKHVALSLPMGRRRTVKARVNHLLDVPKGFDAQPLRFRWQFAVAAATGIVGMCLVSLRVVALEPPGAPDQASVRQEASAPVPDDSAETKQARSAPTEEGRLRGVGPLSGTVVDPQGRPVGNAKVLLSHVQETGVTSLLQETTTDESGRFQIAGWRGRDGAKGWEWPALVAIDGEGRFGGVTGAYIRYDTGPHEPRIQLTEIQDYTGRLVNEDGQPIADARISPEAWYGVPPGEYSSQNHFALPTSLIEQITAITDANGNFVLHGVPKYGKIWATIAADPLGSLWTSFTLTKPLTIPIGRPGSLRGSILAEGSETGLAGVNLWVRSAGSDSEIASAHYLRFSQDEVASDEQGRFHLRLLPGKYRVGASPPSDMPYAAAHLEDVIIGSGVETLVSLALPRAIRVDGRIVDKGNGEGVAGGRVSFRRLDDDGNRSPWTYTSTDAQGYYSVHVQPGKIEVAVSANLARGRESFLLTSSGHGKGHATFSDGVLIWKSRMSP